MLAKLIAKYSAKLEAVRKKLVKGNLSEDDHHWLCHIENLLEEMISDLETPDI